MDLILYCRLIPICENGNDISGDIAHVLEVPSFNRFILAPAESTKSQKAIPKLHLQSLVIATLPLQPSPPKALTAHVRAMVNLLGHD